MTVVRRRMTGHKSNRTCVYYGNRNHLQSRVFLARIWKGQEPIRAINIIQLIKFISGLQQLAKIYLGKVKSPT